MADPVIVAIPTGESREARVWPDDSYACPWCGGSVASPEHPTYVERGDYPDYIRQAWEAHACANPACFARVSPPFPVESIVRLRAEAQARRDEEARRKRDHEAAMARIAAERQDLADRWTAARDEAERRGACVTCLRASAWHDFGNPWNPPDRPHGRAKFVRHRGECPRR